MTEHDGEDDKRKQGHAEDQYQRHAIPKQPLAFTLCDQQESGFWRRRHRRDRQSR